MGTKCYEMVQTIIYYYGHIHEVMILGNTVKPLNNGQVGDNINSHALSLLERLSSSRRFKLYCYYRETNFLGPESCPLQRGF